LESGEDRALAVQMGRLPPFQSQSAVSYFSACCHLHFPADRPDVTGMWQQLNRPRNNYCITTATLMAIRTTSRKVQL